MIMKRIARIPLDEAALRREYRDADTSPYWLAIRAEREECPDPRVMPQAPTFGNVRIEGDHWAVYVPDACECNGSGCPARGQCKAWRTDGNVTYGQHLLVDGYWLWHCPVWAQNNQQED